MLLTYGDPPLLSLGIVLDAAAAPGARPCCQVDLQVGLQAAGALHAATWLRPEGRNSSGSSILMPTC